MSDIRLGIVGAGNIAKEHLKVIQAMESVRAVGITSRTLSKAEKLAKLFFIDHVCETTDDLLECCSLDGVMILVSADQIYKTTINLIPNGIPIFLEKPPGLFPEQTRTLGELASRHGTKNMVGFNRRYYSIFHEGLNIINKHGGLLGLSVEGHERFWKIDGGQIPNNIRENWIYANSTHTIDLLRLFGGEVKSFNAFSNSLKEINGDQFVASMEFESGALGTFTSHWYSPGGWSVTLYGKSVTVFFKPLEKGIWLDTDYNQYEIKPDIIETKYKPGFFGQLKAFCNMLQYDKLEWPGQDLLKSCKTMNLAQKFVNA